MKVTTGPVSTTTMPNATADPTDTNSPRWKALDPAQRRVLGVLVEKAKTTPAGYPMTLNAIVVGSNQKNNRDPLTAYDEIDVGNALVELQTLGAVKEIDWVGRVPKYKHVAYEWLGVTPVELAVMTELLLRGPQALGELRARAARMEAIEDLGALKPVVDGLVARGLMVALTPPGRGQVVTHNLYPAGELAEIQAGRGSRTTHASPQSPSPRPEATDLQGELAELRAQVTLLSERLARLESRLDDS